ncbi:MAG: hypothetical protein R3C01_14900 [Planctomycetaceae bacterium]
MTKLTTWAVLMGLMVTGAFALSVSVGQIPVPGIDTQGALNEQMAGVVGGKVKLNDKKGTFSAKLKGMAPNESGAKAKHMIPFNEVVMGYSASGDATATYKKPKKKAPNVSDVSVKAKGMISPPEVF